MPINACYGVEGFLFYFPVIYYDQQEAGFKLSVFLGAAGNLTVALGLHHRHRQPTDQWFVFDW